MSDVYKISPRVLEKVNLSSQTKDCASALAQQPLNSYSTEDTQTELTLTQLCVILNDSFNIRINEITNLLLGELKEYIGVLGELKNIVTIATKTIEEKCRKINQLEKDSLEYSKKVDNLISRVYNLEEKEKEKTIKSNNHNLNNKNSENVPANELLNRISRLNNVIIYNINESNDKNDKYIIGGILK